MIVLERARNDLRRAGAAAVHERDQWHPRPGLLRAVAEGLIRGRGAAARRDDRLSRIEEQLRHGHSLFQRAACIAAQIQDDRSRAARAQRVYHASQITRRISAERRQLHVTDAVRETSATNGAHFDRATGERQNRMLAGESRSAALTVQRQPHRAAGRTAQRGLDLLDAETERRLPVDRDDWIAGPDAGAVGGTTRHRSDHGDDAVANVDLEANANGLASRQLQRLPVPRRREELAMGVVHFLHETGRSAAVHVVRRDRVDVVFAQTRHHFVQETRGRHGGPGLAAAASLDEQPA